MDTETLNQIRHFCSHFAGHEESFVLIGGSACSCWYADSPTSFRGTRDIDVVIVQNDDMMFGAVEAIEEAGRKTGPDGDIILISFDACRIALQKILDGTLNVDVECNPLQGGYLGEIITALEKGETLPKEIYVEESVFDSSNTKESIEQRTY